MDTADAGRMHVDFRKWGNIPHWQFEMERLGEDDHGLWLWAPAGTEARRGREPPHSIEHDFVKLVRPGAWWSAIWNRDDPIEVYVDVTTPAEVSDDRITMVDLDLDVVRFRSDGHTAVLDEDEFVDHQQTLGYPEHVVATARATAAWLAIALEQRTEPFGAVGDEWLAKL